MTISVADQFEYTAPVIAVDGAAVHMASQLLGMTNTVFGSFAAWR